MSQSQSSSVALAVLFQDIVPPMINGARKPKKPNGYKDSGADIAYTLQQKGIKVLTPKSSPDPLSDADWCFPDTEDGILAAVRQGATHLWANTILFTAHPLQNSAELRPYGSQIHIIGQPPRLVERFDDKAYLNDRLRDLESYTLPRSWLVQPENLDLLNESIEKYPVVAKPVRGRGSYGVKVCHDQTALQDHVAGLLQESPTVMIEDYLAGEEATITVMSPSPERPEYWCLPPVTRFNHFEGVAPYNGVVAVTANSRIVRDEELAKDSSYQAIMDECQRVAELIQAKAPIRIDVRRFSEGSKFAIFDINMKPVRRGRPGREDQDSLTAMAAAAIGWDYGTLLQKILDASQTLSSFREYHSSI
ncbi:hypothetical protein UA08_01143 [Talaromyces atroroseus]|uniref:ATP-grasp domain-containing protein n=1 Tax=Talaromyces atroroseus TaxID=1441469 RepID=A0A1Q5QC21_TALAT|nr:hypothetical protein UA08_01143 [Talaromyces atroroseus]OKL63485.1 hypothetical protein UA08_01143 [Talaromyces atroroseus]